MTNQECQNITAGRLRDWSRHLARGHATPLLLLAVGHDQRCGQITICTVEQMDTANIIAALRSALDQLCREGEPK